MMDRRTLLLGGTALIGGLFAARWFGMDDSTLAAPTDGKTFEIELSEAEWRKKLSEAQFEILREHGTERAFSHPYDKEIRAGLYHCAGCDLPVYSSEAKYDSKTGWPSFWKPLDNAIGQAPDDTLFVSRTEIHCRRCGGHLGHVFDDGPEPTGLRYCMNGVAMKFIPGATMPAA